MGHNKKSSKRELYYDISLLQEMKKISNNLTLYLKEIEKEEQTKAEVCRRKEITNTINVRSEINELET